MQTVATPAYITNSVRQVFLRVLTTWTNNAAAPTDLTPWVNGATTSRSIQDIPDFLSQIVGVGAADGSLKLSGRALDSTGVLRSAVDIFSPYKSNTSSPAHAKNFGLGNPLTIDVGFAAIGAPRSSAEWVRIFTGKMGKVHVDSASMEVELDLIDNSDDVVGTVTVPIGRGYWNPTTLEPKSTFSPLVLVEAALAGSGRNFFAAAQSTGTISRINNVGGMIDSVGSSRVVAQRQMYANVAGSPSPLIADQQCVVQLPMQLTIASFSYISWQGWVYLPTYSPGNDELIAQFGDQSQSEYALRIVVDKVTHKIRIQGLDYFNPTSPFDMIFYDNALNPYTDQSAAIPLQTWTHVKVDFAFSEEGAVGTYYIEPSVRVEINGSSLYGDLYPNGSSSALRAPSGSLWNQSPSNYYLGRFGTGMSSAPADILIVGTQLAWRSNVADDPTSSSFGPIHARTNNLPAHFWDSTYTFSQGFSYDIQADTTPEIAVIPQISDTPDAWQMILDVASAFGAVSWLAEDGHYVWWSRNVWRNKMVQTPVLSLDKTLENLVFDENLSSLKKQVQANVNRFKGQQVTVSTPLITVSELLTFPANATTKVFLSTDDIFVQFVAPLVDGIRPTSGIKATRLSWYQAVKNSAVGDPAAQLIHNLTVSLISTNQGLQLTVVNPNAFDVSFWAPGSISDNYLLIAGGGVTKASPIQISSPVTPNGSRDILTLADDDYRQDIAQTQQLIAVLYTETNRPLPVFSPFTIPGDSRLQIGDTVNILATKSMSAQIPAILVGVDMDISISEDSFTFNTTMIARAVAPPTGFTLNVPGRAELNPANPTTILEA